MHARAKPGTTAHRYRNSLAVSRSGIGAGQFVHPQTVPDETGDTPAAKELIEVLLTLQQLSMDWYLHEIGASGERLADCASALARLRGVASSASLLENVCEEVLLRCGFHRAAFSKVEGRGWKPVLIHDRSGPSETSWFTQWGSRPVPFI